MAARKASPVIGVLGGGQLGRMFIEAANRRSVQVNVLDAEFSPAKQISAHAGHVTGSFSEPKSVEKLADTSDILTIEIEHVDTHALEHVASRVRIEPSWRTIRIIQDKYEQKQHLRGHNIALPDFVEVRSQDDLHHACQQLGYPLMLKAKTQAYDGRGNYPVKSETDIPNAFTSLGDRPLYAEKWAPFTKELAVMVVKTTEQTLSFPTVETVHQDSICKLVYAPARDVSHSTNAAAQELARAAVATFKGKGVFGVEMFLLKDESLLVNEIAPRPHNSGHYTIEACPISQYEAHLRAILNIPIPETSLRLRESAIMLNILGGAAPDSHLQLAALADDIPNASTHLYGKGPGRPGRKMGHITLTARSINTAERLIQPLVAAADALRAERTDIDPASKIPTPPKPPVQPLVSITTGSQSDQPVLETCYGLLASLDIPHEKRITSAHRTPWEMAQFAASARGRGVKVIIAAAGGAAHLPGMVAAFSKSIAVVGLPIKPSVGDGTDSLLSMTNMPRGVPVLTVGVNNAVNAALGAARILAGWDEELKGRLEAWMDQKGDESRKNDQALREGNLKELER